MCMYEKQVAESVDWLPALKPGIALALQPAKRPLWKDILIPIEVKNDRSDMLLQALTPEPYFTYSIFFHYTERNVRLCFCSRNGVISTPSYNLDDMGGFTATIQGFVGMLSLEDEAAAGILPLETVPEWFRSLTGKTYIEGECLSKRIELRGRGTKAAVYVEQRGNSPVAPALGQEADEMEAHKLASPIQVLQHISNRPVAVKLPGYASLGREG